MTTDPATELTLAAADHYGDLDALTEGSVAELAYQLDRLLRIDGVLREARAALTAELAARMTEDSMTISGIGELTRSPRRATWCEDGKDRLRSALSSAIAAEVSTSQLTGEKDPMAARAAELAVNKTLDVVSWSGALASAKKLARPVNPTEFKGDITGYTVSLSPDEEV